MMVPDASLPFKNNTGTVGVLIHLLISQEQKDQEPEARDKSTQIVSRSENQLNTVVGISY